MKSKRFKEVLYEAPKELDSFVKEYPNELIKYNKRDIWVVEPKDTFNHPVKFGVDWKLLD